MNQPQANLWIHLLKKMLRDVLQKADCLPVRDVESLNKMLQEGQEIWVDASERPIPRPGDKDVQQAFYSGKKHHTIKNLFVSSLQNSILYLSLTYGSVVHDKTICDEEELYFSKKVTLWLDSGFEGFNPEKTTINRPKKKPGKKELTDEEKKQNQAICVKVEHAIGQCKVFKIVRDEIRVFKNDFRDLAMLLAFPFKF